MTLESLIILIPLLPLAAAIVVGCFGWLLKERSHLPVVAALAASFVLSLVLVVRVNSEANSQAEDKSNKSIGYERTVTLWQWASVSNVYPAKIKHPADLSARVATRPAIVPGPSPSQSRDFNVEVTLRTDPLTAIMLTMITFISTLVAIYSIGYMHGERGYWRFFAFIALFVFSMTMVVSVSNFVLLYVFWEAVGMCSYLLIGFWYHKPEAAAAGKKAFLVNRVGDCGFALGLFLIWTTYGTLDFHDMPANVDSTTTVTSAQSQPVQSVGVFGQTRLAAPAGQGYVGGAVGTAICLLLMLGACGKSAQFPLHVWLPDAMEGPTPVSALIHAATMVTAGVYMVTRCTPLFVAAPQATYAVALIGCFTALLAGLIAVTQTDLKRVLAYSTISQLGYMFLSLGIGILPGIVFGMFHLFTHAFFKALLFLGAGSVMHAMAGIVDMRRFGGLRRLMPITFWTFLIGCLALSGVTPFAGFWSKDGILATAYERAQQAGGAEAVFGIAGLTPAKFYLVLFWVGMATALLTAFYTFRAMFMTFFGPERIPPEAAHHAHESPAVMTGPLVILAACAIVVGFLFVGSFGGLLSETPSLAWRSVPNFPAVEEGSQENVHSYVAVLSTVFALAGIGLAAFLYLGDRRQVAGLARSLGPMYWLSYGKFFFDPIYDWLVVRPLAGLARLFNWLDRWLVDGLVNLFGAIPAVGGAALRSLQNGVVQFYALAMVLGLLVLIGALIAWPGK